MNTVVEFLTEEPIENIMTCLNFCLDRVIFLGYEKVIKRQESRITHFLTESCNVKEVLFTQVPRQDLQATEDILEKLIAREKQLDNAVYFDITGGLELTLVAFGRISKKYRAPIHMYDLDNNTLVDLDRDVDRHITSDLPRQHIKLTIPQLIELFGGKVNMGLHKHSKNANDAEFVIDVKNMYAIAERSWEAWNSLSFFMRGHMLPDDSLHVKVSKKAINRALQGIRGQITSISQIESYLNIFAKKGLIRDYYNTAEGFDYTIKNEKIKDFLWDSGSVLELYTYLQMQKESDDCMVGVHIDWDGIIHKNVGDDVLNEIDVLALKGYRLIFISCKSGSMNGDKPLHALYELQTVAQRFGGKYALKVLVAPQKMGWIYKERAKEMNIAIRIVM